MLSGIHTGLGSGNSPCRLNDFHKASGSSKSQASDRVIYRPCSCIVYYVYYYVPLEIALLFFISREIRKLIVPSWISFWWKKKNVKDRRLLPPEKLQTHIMLERDPARSLTRLLYFSANLRLLKPLQQFFQGHKFDSGGSVYSPAAENLPWRISCRGDAIPTSIGVKLVSLTIVTFPFLDQIPLCRTAALSAIKKIINLLLDNVNYFPIRHHYVKYTCRPL